MSAWEQQAAAGGALLQVRAAWQRRLDAVQLFIQAPPQVRHCFLDFCRAHAAAPGGLGCWGGRGRRGAAWGRIGACAASPAWAHAGSLPGTMASRSPRTAPPSRPRAQPQLQPLRWRPGWLPPTGRGRRRCCRRCCRCSLPPGGRRWPAARILHDQQVIATRLAHGRSGRSSFLKPVEPHLQTRACRACRPPSAAAPTPRERGQGPLAPLTVSSC